MKLPAQIAIVGIHTDIGKTIVSAVLAEALHADYWKPVQAGALDHSDSKIVATLVSNPASRIHPEASRLKMAASPHTAQRAERLQIHAKDFTIPKTSNTLLIETAGGLLSPIDQQHTMADFLQHFKLPAFLVAETYLGSINHTLLCLEVLKTRSIPLLGIIANKTIDVHALDFIQTYTAAQPVFKIPELSPLNRETVHQAARQLLHQINEYEQTT